MHNARYIDVEYSASELANIDKLLKKSIEESQKIKDSILMEINILNDDKNKLELEIKNLVQERKKLLARNGNIKIVEKIIDKPIEVIKEVLIDKIIEKPVIVYKDKIVEKIVYRDKNVIVYKDKIVDKIIDKPVEVIKEVPVEVIKEVFIEVPIDDKNISERELDLKKLYKELDDKVKYFNEHKDSLEKIYKDRMNSINKIKSDFISEVNKRNMGEFTKKITDI